jgi:hypothetical protein
MKEGFAADSRRLSQIRQRDLKLIRVNQRLDVFHDGDHMPLSDLLRVSVPPW